MTTPQTPDPNGTENHLPPEGSAHPPVSPPDSAAWLAAMPPEIVSAAESMLVDPRLIDIISEDIIAIGIVGETRLVRILYLTGTSRLLGSPIAVIVQGPTSSGKSEVVERVGGMFPDECVIRATDITANALYYAPPGSLVHRFVIGGERSRLENGARAETTRALREMLSTRKLHKVVTQRRNGEMVTEIIVQPGPIAFVETTTLTDVFDEDANRCLLLSTDESEAQTRRVMGAQAASATGDRPDVSDILAKHHALQRLLRRCHVVIPFAKQLADRIPAERQEARRVMPLIYAVISAVTLLYQRQRSSGPITDESTIIATLEDWAIARELLIDPIGRALGGGPSGAVRRFGERLLAHFKHTPFTTAKVKDTDPIVRSKGKINEYLRELANCGAAECMVESLGTKPAVWRMLALVPSHGQAWLPTVDELRASMSSSGAVSQGGGLGAASDSSSKTCENCDPPPVGAAPEPQVRIDGVEMKPRPQDPSDASAPNDAGATQVLGRNTVVYRCPAAPVVSRVIHIQPQP